MDYSYIGVIKKTKNISKVLVCSKEGKYYVWETSNSQLVNSWDHFPCSLSPSELTLATPRQIEVGRGSLWSPNQSNVMVEICYYGVVSGGKSKKTILVKYKTVNPTWFIISVSVDSLRDIKIGDSILVDNRKLSIARQDHIDAGLGYGKLKRKKRVSVL